MKPSWRHITGGLFGLSLGAVMLLWTLPERLTIYGKIQEGRVLPVNLRSIFEQAKEESSAQFLALYFAKDIDTACDCGAAERVVASHGGRLVVIESKIAPFFDIPYIHNGVQYQLADSVLITVSDTGKVLAIHRGLTNTHLVFGLGMPDRLGRSADAIQYGWNKLLSGVTQFLHDRV